MSNNRRLNLTKKEKTEQATAANNKFFVVCDSTNNVSREGAGSCYATVRGMGASVTFN